MNTGTMAAVVTTGNGGVEMLEMRDVLIRARPGRGACSRARCGRDQHRDQHTLGMVFVIGVVLDR